MALITFSFATFVASVVLPWLIETEEEGPTEFTPRPPESIASLLVELQKWKPTMLSAWAYSIVIFAAAMALGVFIRAFRRDPYLHGSETKSLDCFLPRFSVNQHVDIVIARLMVVTDS